MFKEITITNANNFYSFISFRINGLKDGITVGIVPDPNSHGQALSVAYKGDIKIVPLSANTTKIKKIGVEEIPVNAKTYPLKNQEVWMHEPVVLQNPEDFWKHERTHYGEPHLLELMDEWGVNGSNYADFRSVIQEHCFDKGLYSFDDIEKSWKEHQESIKNAVEDIKKNGNN